MEATKAFFRRYSREERDADFEAGFIEQLLPPLPRNTRISYLSRRRDFLLTPDVPPRRKSFFGDRRPLRPPPPPSAERRTLKKARVERSARIRGYSKVAVTSLQKMALNIRGLTGTDVLAFHELSRLGFYRIGAISETPNESERHTSRRAA
jgi:hypothetical protein